MDPVFTLIIALSLAVLWFSAAAQKLSAFAVFAATLADYRIVPKGLVNVSSGIVVGFELALGVGLVVPMTRSAALIASAVLLLAYAAAMALNLLRGRRHIDCGCMGPAARQSLSGWLVARNLTIALFAVITAGSLAPRPMVWVDFFTIAAGVTSLAFVYATANHLAANAPLLAQLRNTS